MEQLRTLGLVDSDGTPIASHIEPCSSASSARLRREFPTLQDDVAVVEVMEEPGRRIARREAEIGPIEKLYGYAWTTVRTVAISRMRRGSLRLIQKTLDSEASAALLAATPAAFGSAEQIERDILMKQVRAKLVAGRVGSVLVEGERPLEPRDRAIPRSVRLRRRHVVHENEAEASQDAGLKSADGPSRAAVLHDGQRLELRGLATTNTGPAMAHPSQLSDDDAQGARRPRRGSQPRESQSRTQRLSASPDVDRARGDGAPGRRSRVPAPVELLGVLSRVPHAAGRSEGSRCCDSRNQKVRICRRSRLGGVGGGFSAVWVSSMRTPTLVPVSDPTAESLHAELDLRKFAVMRSEQAAEPPEAVRLPVGLVEVTLLLPVGSSAGTYDIQLLDSDLKTRAVARGEADDSGLRRDGPRNARHARSGSRGLPARHSAARGRLAYSSRARLPLDCHAPSVRVT